jgi:hypothetical protein
LGGHTIRCASNPKRQELIDKIAQNQVGKSLSQKHRDALSETILKRIQAGTWHNSFARCRRHFYKEQSFDGSWEVFLAKWFDEHSIDWVRNQEKFPYVLDKQRSYVPDFYLPDIDCYVEVKGWKTPKDEAKWSQFPRRLVVLSGSDLQALGLPITVRKDWKI